MKRGILLFSLLSCALASGYSAAELTIMHDGLSLYGEYYVPTGVTSPPLVIISHGFGETCSSTARIARALAEVGFATYAYDFAGGSPASRSDGSMLEMSVLTEKADLEAVLDHFLPEYEDIFLLGDSQGGLVSALVAAERGDDISGLILFYPAFVIPDDARRTFSSFSDITDRSRIFGMSVGRRYYEDVYYMDPYKETSAYEGPVLIIHGDRDSIVPISYAERAAESYSSASLSVLAGAGHGFYGSALESACKQSASFIKELL